MEPLRKRFVIRLALHVLFFLSGAAALGYQLVWAKMFSTALGHEMPAVLATIAAFMGGMALGAAFIDRLIPRDIRAGLWLGGLELTIGLWAVIASLAIPHANEIALRLIGLAPGAFRHWLVAFAVPVIVLLPATVAIGATFPAMEKFLSVLAPENFSVGSVYGANTLGAFAGTLLTPFLLMPTLGFSKSCWVLATVNVSVAVAVWIISRAMIRAGNTELAFTSSKPTLRLEVIRSISQRRIAVTLFLTGLLGLSYEAVSVRVLTQVLEGTVFTYATTLAVFLLGTAAGAMGYHLWWRGFNPSRLLATLLSLTSAACLGSVAILARTPGIYRLARGLGDGPLAVLAAELIVSLAVLAGPTFLMGALFSHLVQLTRTGRGRIGDAVALNTLGAALGPVLSVLLLPLIGCQWALVTVGAGYLALSLKLPSMRIVLAAIIAFCFAVSAHLRIVDVPPGGKLLSYQEGVMASIAVLADTNGQRTLRVDNRFQMGGTAAADAEYRQSHVPLLLHPNPQRGLFLGVGTGISLGAATLYPQLKADAVELVPEVVQALPWFELKNFSAGQSPNFRVHVADARRFVRTTDGRYDVIIADLFHPYRDGAGALYTREHFSAIRRLLNPNTPSLFCQWLPLHQLDDPTLRVIVRTFQSVFPNGEAWLLRFNVDVPVVALVGWTGTPHWSPSQVEARLDGGPLSVELKRLALADSLRLFGHVLADAEDLHRFATNAPLNTDDNQRVSFMAPRAAHQHGVKPYASLLALLTSFKAAHVPEDRLFLPADAEFIARLSHYLTARNLYMRGLIHDAERRPEEAMNAYIESARLSPDFTTGYAQALSIANILAPSDPARARKILERLIEVQPERLAAAELFRRLFSP